MTGSVIVCPACIGRGCPPCEGSGLLALPLNPRALPPEMADWPAVFFELDLCREPPECANCEDTGERPRWRGFGTDPCSECERGLEVAIARHEWAQAAHEDAGIEASKERRLERQRLERRR